MAVLSPTSPAGFRRSTHSQTTGEYKQQKGAPYSGSTPDNLSRISEGQDPDTEVQESPVRSGAYAEPGTTDPSFISQGYLQDAITEALETSGASSTGSEVTVTRGSCRSKLSKVHWIPEYTTKTGDQCPLLQFPLPHRTSPFPTV